MFRITISNLSSKGHEVVVVIRPKDVLAQLCANSNMPVITLRPRPQRGGKIGLAFSLLEKIWDVNKIVIKEKPDMLIGSDGTLAVVGKMRGIPAFECSEDDAEAIHLYAKLFFPLYTGIICPDCCSAWKWEDKKIGYPSYHELGYLRPEQFVPDASVVKKYGINPDKTYFVIRFAQLTAHHDDGIKGINTEIAQKIISMLEPHGTIFITSERPLEPQFEKYRVKIDPLDMHHIMAFASMFVGDSQTMSAEAGVLGTPFVHFNDFVGRLSYINELEQKYHLGFGHKTDDPEGMLKSIQTWLDMPDRRTVCAERRNRMLSEKIDYSVFLTSFILDYSKTHDKK